MFKEIINDVLKNYTQNIGSINSIYWECREQSYYIKPCDMSDKEFVKIFEIEYKLCGGK